MTDDVHASWAGFLDDAGPEPGPVDGMVGARVVRERDLPDAPRDLPLRVVLDGGAGGIAGPVALAARRGLQVAAIEVALRDDADPAGNARRVVAAVLAGDALEPPLQVRVGPVPTPGWLAAADELAAAELALVLPLEGEVEAWVDAALDRELPFALTGGTVDDAVAALRTTARLWGDADDLVAGRRWCRSWACPDVAATTAHLRSLDPGGQAAG